MRQLAGLAALLLVLASGAAAEGRHRWALLVGVAAYPEESGIPPLLHPVSEVGALQRFLKDEGGFDRITALTDSAATYEGVHRAFQSLIGQVGRDDLFLFYFSGRGSRLKDDLFTDEHVDNFDECLLPFNADGRTGENFLRDDEIGQFLQRLASTRSCVVIDASYTGGHEEGKGFTSADMPVEADGEYDGFTAGVHRGDFILDSTGVVEVGRRPAVDGWFTSRLLEELKTGRDEDGDGHVGLGEAAVRVADPAGGGAPRLVNEEAVRRFSIVPPLLQVDSDPAGSLIVLDGDTLGVTPAMFAVEPGRHTFAVVRSGYEASPAVPPVVEMLRPGRIHKSVILRPAENLFTIGVLDTSGRPFPNVDVLLNGEKAGTTDTRGLVEVKKRLAPDRLVEVSLIQLGLVFTRGHFALSAPEPGVYDLQVVFEHKPIAMTVVDRDGALWPGIQLWAGDRLLGRANEAGQMVFDERLIGGRANLPQLGLRAAQYGVGYPIAAGNIQPVDATTVRVTIEQQPAELRIRAVCDSLDLGDQVDFAALLFLQEATAANHFGDRLPAYFGKILPGIYQLIVKRPGQADFTQRLQVGPGAQVEVGVPVAPAQAWEELLRLWRQGGLSKSNAARAARLAQMLGRSDLEGLFR
ncbi:MAG: PEGA domain-containing protein [Candidatus Latescibacteria bacterium]|nr:PEGA domain-containing protein [Candidatus Latescibacterota bacterium]